MDKRKFNLAVGSLLHDTGKLLYHFSDSGNHCDIGYDFFKEIISTNDILNCVRYHHADRIKNADISNDDLCYITYIANKIAAFSDGSKNESGDGGSIRNASYESIFNILNNNNGKSAHVPSMLTEKDEINYPSEDIVNYNENFYSKITDTIKNTVSEINESQNFINSLLEVSEACLSYVPSSSRNGELHDISLYDHIKLTSAIALCIFDYALENGITDYKEAFFERSEAFFKENAFQIYSADISGIQNFIYNISRKSALKGLRARSFYLEIMLEHYIDTLITRLDLAKCNVLYTGGGHTYILVPNTASAEKIIAETEHEINQWLLENFDADLYLAGGITSCSANSLRNIPTGSYRNIFAETSKKISHKKLSRYTAEDILKINSRKLPDNERECTICNRSDKLSLWNNDRYICSTCRSLLNLSDSIIGENKNTYFSIISCKGKSPSDNYVALPFDSCMTSDSYDDLTRRIKNDSGYIRSYSKNAVISDHGISSKLWVGDYSASKDFSTLIKNSKGIDRLCVLRADIDNLGTAFVNGFPDNYTTISRTSEFSSKLSLFFKHDINTILRNPKFSVTGDNKTSRNVSVIYSGGDDIFVVGGWDDVIGFAVDLNDSLRKFSLNTLTISAGIGMFTESYPLYAMADETGKLEDFSKHNKDKDSVTLFDKTGRYHWDTLKNKVIGEKLKTIREYMTDNEEHGKSMLYKMLDLIRARKNENRLNISRFAYLLARLAPSDKNAPDYNAEYSRYINFKDIMYKWINSEEDCRQLVTAIYIYIYSVRKKENKND